MSQIHNVMQSNYTILKCTYLDKIQFVVYNLKAKTFLAPLVTVPISLCIVKEKIKRVKSRKQGSTFVCIEYKHWYKHIRKYTVFAMR